MHSAKNANPMKKEVSEGLGLIPARGNNFAAHLCFSCFGHTI